MNSQFVSQYNYLFHKNQFKQRFKLKLFPRFILTENFLVHENQLTGLTISINHNSWETLKFKSFTRYEYLLNKALLADYEMST